LSNPPIQTKDHKVEHLYVRDGDPEIDDCYIEEGTYFWCAATYTGAKAITAVRFN